MADERDMTRTKPARLTRHGFDGPRYDDRSLDKLPTPAMMTSRRTERMARR